MKRIFVRTSIALVGMITWLLPDRANASQSCDGFLPDGVYLQWTCPYGTDCIGPINVYDDDDGTWMITYYGCS